MIRAIRKFLTLSRTERWLLVQAMVALTFVTLALRMVGPGCCYRGLGRLAPMADDGALTGASACRRASLMGRLVRVAANHGLVRANCLAQSMTVWWLLRWQRIPVELRIGVRKQQGLLEAHAWAEYQSRVLNDDADVALRFSPFAGTPGVFESPGADMS
ncbi:MAG: lasso peptide biosynthesis B2 protein [Gammaproteobacteria bacterium]|jgi:hypothetical protein|nr:lasso peptide biosynthesis B2 protein [Gammaproteobacteria bacterium]